MIMNKLHEYLAILGLGITMLACNTHAADSPSESSNETVKLPVDTKIVRVAALVQEEIVAGSILPNKEVTISSEIAKKVKSIHFEEGAWVSKGQVLFKLDDSEIEIKLKQIQADLALAKLTESRLASLLKTESVRQEEYDVALAKLQSMEAMQDLLRLELEKTVISAPFSGKIGIKKVHVGTLVGPGQALVTLQDQNTVKVQFTVGEKYLPYVAVGRQISFSVLGRPNRLSAKISAMEAAIDTQTRTITVHATRSNKHGELSPGMSAKVFFSSVDDNAKGVILPTESLIPSAEGYGVFVVRKGLARITPVTIGNRTESDALITSGLNHGDTVMISNILRSGDGTPVEIASIK